MKVLTVTQNGGLTLYALGVYHGKVDDQADLANVPAEAAEGSLFHTSGYQKVWEKNGDGTWTGLHDGVTVTV